MVIFYSYITVYQRVIDHFFRHPHLSWFQARTFATQMLSDSLWTYRNISYHVLLALLTAKALVGFLDFYGHRFDPQSLSKLGGPWGSSMDVGKQRPSVSRAQAVWCQCGALGLLAPKEPYVLAASTGRSRRRALHSKFPILLCCNFKLNRPADHNSEVFNILIIYHNIYII